MKIEDKINKYLKEFSIGNKINAYKELEKIFRLNQSNAQLRFNIAVIQQLLNLNNEAKENYLYLIDNYGNTKAMFNMYRLYIDEENYLDALKLIDRLVTNNNTSKEIILDKAFVLYKLKKYNDSIELCEKQLLINKKNINFLNILGLNYFGRKEIGIAKKILNEALLIDNDNCFILNSIARIYHEERNSKTAEEYYLKAFENKKDSYEIINNLAGFYREEANYEKAIEFYEKAIRINPNNPSIINNLAKSYFDINKLDLAKKYCLEALSLNKDDGNIQKILSFIYIKNNEYKNGWKFFDGRLNLSDFVERNSSIENIRSKLLYKDNYDTNSNILVLREQGVGDEILYGTMYGDLLNSWKNVTIECDSRLKNLFKNSFPKYKNVFKELGSISSTKRSLEKYENVIYAGSLGNFFRKNKNQFSDGCYLNPDKKLVLKYKRYLQKLSDKYKIGISWKSFKNRYANEKSLFLNDFKNIFNKKKCSFINLQYGDIKRELEEFNLKNDNIINTIPALDLFNDFDDIAAVLKNLDLFITVSNSTAHLAGSIGVKTILIKPVNHAVFHYWNQYGDKTPWYNSITLINKSSFLKLKDISKYLGG